MININIVIININNNNNIKTLICKYNNHNHTLVKIHIKYQIIHKSNNLYSFHNHNHYLIILSNNHKSQYNNPITIVFIIKSNRYYNINRLNNM